MQLTEQQRGMLKTAVLADATAAAHYENGNLQALADRFNETASPSYTVWRVSVSQDEIMQNGFDWVRVDNLSVGKARIWEWLFQNEARSINPSKANVRLGIDEAWKGTAADLAVRTAVYTHCKRPATLVERVFATGAGTDADPATMGVGADGAPIEGPIAYNVFVGL